MDLDLRYLKHLMPGVKFVYHDPNKAVVHDNTGRVLVRKTFTVDRIPDLADKLQALLTPKGGTVLLFCPSRFTSTNPYTIDLALWQRCDLLKD